MKAYPGKAKKMEPGPITNIILPQPGVYNSWSYFTLPKIKQGNKPLPYYTFQNGYQTSYEDIDRNQFNYSEEGDKRSVHTEAPKKTKLGEIIYSKLSKLATSHLQRPSQSQSNLSAPWDPEDDQSGHRHVRSASVDSNSKPVLSRRQILASLEEENSPLGTSLTSQWSASTPSSSPEPLFSRACLIQSISKDDEDWREGFADTQCRQKCNSSGESVVTSDSEELSEQEDRDNEEEHLEEGEEEDHWFHDQDGSDCGAGEHEQSADVTLKSLRWIATLGVGGFGRVELVTVGQNSNKAFALKKMKKSEIQDSKQQQHILNEKMIMQDCDSPFIVKLYKTYHDAKFLYMLMEPCLGGELWTLLRRSKRFCDDTAKFYVACVILAFDYLHDKGIIYRDLKPENLLVDSTGYIKLTDFGFSRKLNNGEQAWTFCGTPEYVAPEIITNKSHDMRADIWSLGILVFELLTGAPPFTKQTTSGQVYPEILKGMKGVHFPNTISASASEIIRLCCRLSSNQRPSLAHLKYFMWFSDMDWHGLANRSLNPPKVPTIENNSDYSNFDTYPVDLEMPQDDYSEWTNDF